MSFLVLVLAAGAIVGATAFWARSTAATGWYATALAGRTIVLDPGHGGVDPGAHYREEILEKDLVLQIAGRLKRFLENAGATVIMTRTGDYDLAPPEIKSLAARKRYDLRARVDLANRAGADIFLSIHVNTSRDPGKAGVHVYYSEKPGSDVLARYIEEEMWRYIGKERMPLPGRYFVLRETRMPAVLVEAGFLSNPREKALLCDGNYQERLSWAIFRGVVRYFGETASSGM
ncbi:N-acetylmuramoyl-L-alanine amidase family protein [Thermodesulfitimonas autotrophica]|uniref:N-acetylmuramoyl-L-alanine amidase family protein n=1 Tax=Thermodesulfitimonas autotrophica TaxID=1894989 RepID=UPI002FDFBCED